MRWNDCTGTDCLTPKGFTLARVRLAEGVFVDLYNVHTNAGDTDAALAARRANIAQLSAFVRANSAGNAVIVMGDTNTRYTRAGDTIRTLVADNGLTDAWVQLAKGVRPRAGRRPAAVPGLRAARRLRGGRQDPLPRQRPRLPDRDPLPRRMGVLPGRGRRQPLRPLPAHRGLLLHAQPAAAGERLLRRAARHGLQRRRRPPGRTGSAHSHAARRRPPGRRVPGPRRRYGPRPRRHRRYGRLPSPWPPGSTSPRCGSARGRKDGRTRVFSAAFTTDRGRGLAAGTPTADTTTFTAPAGWQIVGFTGRSGTEIDKLGVLYAPIG